MKKELKEKQQKVCVIEDTTKIAISPISFDVFATENGPVQCESYFNFSNQYMLDQNIMNDVKQNPVNVLHRRFALQSIFEDRSMFYLANAMQHAMQHVYNLDCVAGKRISGLLPSIENMCGQILNSYPVYFDIFSYMNGPFNSEILQDYAIAIGATVYNAVYMYSIEEDPNIAKEFSKEFIYKFTQNVQMLINEFLTVYMPAGFPEIELQIGR